MSDGQRDAYLVDAYFALAAFVLGVCLAVAVVFVIAQRLLIEAQDLIIAKQDAALKRFAPFDPDGDGRPGGRKRHDPYIER